MLSRRTLRILTTLASRDRIRAEQAAAEAARKLAHLDRQEATLTGYMAEIGTRLSEAGEVTGLDLKSYGTFLELGLRARITNEDNLAQGRVAQDRALDQLARMTERHRAIDRARDAAEAEAARQAERAADQALSLSGASSGTSRRGRSGLSPPDARQASRRQT